MPNQPKTPLRAVRIPDSVWKPAQLRAVSEHVSVTSVVLAALRDYGGGKPGATSGDPVTSR